MKKTSRKAGRYLILIALLWLPAATQQTVPQAQEQSQGGANTAGTFKPIKDERNRPITAGGFVEGAPSYFTDITARTGLQKFCHVAGTQDKRYILESPSGGVALFDYDNDGWLDVYLVNGSTFAALQDKEPAPRAALFHNNKDGTFSDVTAKAGVANERWGFGVAAGDFDNDGWTDLYVTNFGKNRLYRNNGPSGGDVTFTDVAEKLDAALNSWSTGATFGDYDGDGDLDLFVVGYVQFDPAHPPEPRTTRGGQKYCFFRGQPVMCGPRGLDGAPDHLLRNDGSKFTDVSKAAGVADEKGYYGFGAAFCDLNDDGKLDLLVANDSTPKFLYLNKGNGTFADASYESGFALNEDGREQAGMGLAVGDYDNDGRPDVYITNFSDDTNTLYRNEGAGQFNDVTYRTGHGTPTIPFLGWGTGFLDFDNDGWKDVFIANGHVYPQVDKYDWGTTWAQRPLLFKNKSGKTFEVTPAATNSGLAVVKSARGAAFGDLDNDGRIDVVVNNCDDTPTVLHNETKAAGHWLSLKLASGKRDAIGATAWLTANGQRQRADVISGGSYCSQSDLRLHFGLGTATKVEKLEIRWPSGKHQRLVVKDINRTLIIREEESGVLPTRNNKVDRRGFTINNSGGIPKRRTFRQSFPLFD